MKKQIRSRRPQLIYIIVVLENFSNSQEKTCIRVFVKQTGTSLKKCFGTSCELNFAKFSAKLLLEAIARRCSVRKVFLKISPVSGAGILRNI